ncbi:MAG: dTDP-4-amino-4,6-dideoxygalactose transaminase [Gaiellaceae bacterium]
MTEIPFNRPYTTGSEFGYIEEAIANAHLSGNGPFARRCASWLEENVGCCRALLTHSCTGALEMAAILADVGPGDEVIMPSFTFVSTANAFVLRGATPVFVDIREDTLNLDERVLSAAITPSTRAICVVHYAGVGCAMDEISAIAEDAGVPVIEDAAQGILATYKGKPLGSLGTLATLSFHETKNVHCGEGGALLVNQQSLIDRAEVIHEKGTDRRRFMRGQVDKYTWVDVGSSFLLSDINCAFLWGQLERAWEITQRRLRIWETYHVALAELEDAGALRRPVVPPECSHNAHMYYVLLESGDVRDHVLAFLGQHEINAVFHYAPLHNSTAGRRYARTAGSLPITEAAAERLIRLPLWPEMTDADVAQVVEALTQAVSMRPARA